MMGKLNVKSGVGAFQILTMEGRRRYARGRGAGVGMGGGDDVFPFSVPFVEFPSQSPAAESQPRINFKGRLRNAEETTSFPGLFLFNKKWPKNKAGHKGNGKCRSAGSLRYRNAYLT